MKGLYRRISCEQSAGHIQELKTGNKSFDNVAKILEQSHQMKIAFLKKKNEDQFERRECPVS
jgi:hypothetical protein